MFRPKRSIEVYVRNKNRYNPKTREREFLHVSITDYAGTTIGAVKEDVRRQCRHGVKLDELFLDNEPLADDRSVAHYNLDNGTILESTSNPLLVACLYIKAAEVVQEQEGNPLDENIQNWTKKSLPKKWTLIKVLLNSDNSERGQPRHFPTVDDFVTFLNRLGKKGATMHPNFTERDLREMEGVYKREYLGRYRDPLAAFIDQYAVRLGFLDPELVEEPVPAAANPVLPVPVMGRGLTAPRIHGNYVGVGRDFPLAGGGLQAPWRQNQTVVLGNQNNRATGQPGANAVGGYQGYGPQDGVGYEAVGGRPHVVVGGRRGVVPANRGQVQPLGRGARRGANRGRKKDRPCDDCEADVAEVYCRDCHNAAGSNGLCLCQRCSDVLHRGATRRQHQLADISEAPKAMKDDNSYCPRAFLAPFAILLGLYSGLTEGNPVLSMTEDEVKARAQSLTDTDLQQKQAGKYVGGFDCMENTLMDKGLVQKEAAVVPTYALTARGQALGARLYTFYKTMSAYLVSAGAPTVNISVKSTVCGTRKICLLVDENERDKARLLGFAAEKGVDAQTRYLPAGDYLWILTPPMIDPSLPYTATDTSMEEVLPFIVERKSWEDFEHSVNSTRFQRQVNNMLGSGVKNCFYLMEGSLTGLRSNPTLQQQRNLKSLVENLLLEYSFYVSYTTSWMKSAQWLFWMTSMIVHGHKLGLFQNDTISYQDYNSRVARQRGAAVADHGFSMMAGQTHCWTAQHFVDLIFRDGSNEDRMLASVKRCLNLATFPKTLVVVQDLEAYNKKRQSLLNKCLFAVNDTPDKAKACVNTWLTPNLHSLLHYDITCYWQLHLQVVLGVYVVRTEKSTETERWQQQFQDGTHRGTAAGDRNHPAARTNKSKSPRKQVKRPKIDNPVATTIKGSNSVASETVPTPIVSAFSGSGYVLGTSGAAEGVKVEEAGTRSLSADDYANSQNDEEILQQVIAQSMAEVPSTQGIGADLLSKTRSEEYDVLDLNTGILPSTALVKTDIPESVDEEDRLLRLALEASKQEQKTPVKSRKRAHGAEVTELVERHSEKKIARNLMEDEELNLALELSKKEINRNKPVVCDKEIDEEKLLRIAIERSKVENYSPMKKPVVCTIDQAAPACRSGSGGNVESNREHLLRLAAEIGGRHAVGQVSSATSPSVKDQFVVQQGELAAEPEVIVLQDSQELEGTDCDEQEHSPAKVGNRQAVEECDVPAIHCTELQATDTNVESVSKTGDNTVCAVPEKIIENSDAACNSVEKDTNEGSIQAFQNSSIHKHSDSRKDREPEGKQISSARDDNDEIVLDGFQEDEDTGNEEEEELIGPSPVKKPGLNWSLTRNSFSSSQRASQSPVSQLSVSVLAGEYSSQHPEVMKDSSSVEKDELDTSGGRPFNLHSNLFPDSSDSEGSEADIFEEEVSPKCTLSGVEKGDTQITEHPKVHESACKKKSNDSLTLENEGEYFVCSTATVERGCVLSPVSDKCQSGSDCVEDTWTGSGDVENSGRDEGESHKGIASGCSCGDTVSCHCQKGEGNRLDAPGGDPDTMTGQGEDNCSEMEELSIPFSYDDDEAMAVDSCAFDGNVNDEVDDGNSGDELPQIGQPKSRRVEHTEKRICQEAKASCGESYTSGTGLEAKETGSSTAVHAENDIHVSHKVMGNIVSVKSEPKTDSFEQDLTDSKSVDTNTRPAAVTDDAELAKALQELFDRESGSASDTVKEEAADDNLGLTDEEYARLLQTQLDAELAGQGPAKHSGDNSAGGGGVSEQVLDDEKVAQQIQRELDSERTGDHAKEESSSSDLDTALQRSRLERLFKAEQMKREQEAAQLEDYRRRHKEKYQSSQTGSSPRMSHAGVLGGRLLVPSPSPVRHQGQGHSVTSPGSQVNRGRHSPAIIGSLTPTSSFRHSGMMIEGGQRVPVFEDKRSVNIPARASQLSESRCHGNSLSAVRNVGLSGMGTPGAGSRSDMGNSSKLHGNLPYSIDLTARRPPHTECPTQTVKSESEVILLDDIQEDKLFSQGSQIPSSSCQGNTSNVTCGNCGEKGHTRISKHCPNFYSASECARREEHQQKLQQKKEEKLREDRDTITMLSNHRQEIDTINNTLQQRSKELEAQVKAKTKKLEAAEKRNRKK